jgi:hypothetical protein
MGDSMSVVFQSYDGLVVGIGERGRRWRVCDTSSGWVLEYRDAGDVAATYVSTHPSLEAAMEAAGR